MLDSIKKKLSNQDGLSLVEMLVTSTILLLVSIIMATGIPAANQVYMRVVDTSNAQLLLATTSTRLRDELSVANVSVEPNCSGSIAVFTSYELGATTLKGTDGITINGMPLVPQAGGNEGAKQRLTASFEGIAYSNGVFTITNLEVKKNGSGVALARFESINIKTLATPSITSP